MRRFVVFTDLDGTFIDFATYAPGPALAAARQILLAGDLVVFCSSKTSAEQLALLERFQLEIAAIVENGAGVLLPEPLKLWPGNLGERRRGYRLVSAAAWAEATVAQTDQVDGDMPARLAAVIRQVEAATGLNLKPYHCIRDADLANLTGLEISAAARARQRDFSETLTAELSPAQWREVGELFASLGYLLQCGGRFHTVTATGVDKGAAVRAFMRELQTCCPQEQTFESVGVGDSENDVPLLKAVDRPYVVRRPDGGYMSAVDGAEPLDGIGPHGWAMLPAVLKRAYHQRPAGRFLSN